jgi:2-methylcitrate synthase
MSPIDEKAYSPGLEGVIAGESALCQVDEGESGLRYRGYAVEDLAHSAGFDEVAYLLLFGTLPTRKELDRFNEQIAAAWELPAPTQRILRDAPSNAHPMDILRTGVSVLGMIDPDAADCSHEANLRKAIRLLAHIPLVMACAYRHARGKPMVWPKPGLSLADNLLWLLTDRHGDETSHAMGRLLNVSLILYAEHEFNASTFAARVTASTMTDLHSAVTAAIGTLKGPLHGGANEAVAAMFCDIGTPDGAERWVRDALATKRRVMGFGHRVLKKGDSRSLIIQRHAETLSRTCGDARWYAMARTIDGIMQEEKGLFPNLDFYTAVAYLLMDIPRELSTPVFVCSRIAGWCAHVIEQQDHNRLIRPRALYTGPPPQTYVDIDQRA